MLVMVSTWYVGGTFVGGAYEKQFNTVKDQGKCSSEVGTRILRSCLPHSFRIGLKVADCYKMENF